MSICNNCQRSAERSRDSFTQRERIQILSSAATMMRHLNANINSPSGDKEVCNSIITKMLLSVEPALRTVLIEQLRESAGLEIVLNKCPHGIQGIL